MSNISSWTIGQEKNPYGVGPKYPIWVIRSSDNRVMMRCFSSNQAIKLLGEHYGQKTFTIKKSEL